MRYPRVRHATATRPYPHIRGNQARRFSMNELLSCGRCSGHRPAPDPHRILEKDERRRVSVGADFMWPPMTMQPFEIDIIRRGDALVLVVEGEIDIATAPLLEQHLTDAEATDTPVVIIDLDRVSFMDSTGLQVLVAHTLSEAKGRRIRLTKGSPQVQRLFTVSGMLDHLPFVTAD